MLTHSEKSNDLLVRLTQFMERHIYANEGEYAAQLETASERFAPLPLVEELKQLARAEGLWNLFVPPAFAEFSPVGGLTNLDYAPLAERMGARVEHRVVLDVLIRVPFDRVDRD